eukprot:GEZU01012362.1.p1 GENE.GEZU01012362.1~~GEZU01012362.1.p1  ORF type:complete len:443 (+),score=114.19 GEZU01012362.1:105-1433(+)
MRNYLLRRLKMIYPIIQAPMAGGPTTPELVAAVSNAGGLGSFAGAYLTGEQCRQAIRTIRDLTDKPFAVNLFIPSTMQPHLEEVQDANNKKKKNPLRDDRDAFVTRNNRRIQLMQQFLRPYYESLKGAPGESSSSMNALDAESILRREAELFEEQLSVVLEEQVPVLSFTMGAPDAQTMKRIRDNVKSDGNDGIQGNVFVMGTATTVEEALYLENKVGVDAIVAQGSEAGGHRGSFLNADQRDPSTYMSTMALVPQMTNLDHGVRIPVIAAGGIMNGRGLVAALCLGASAAQMGTAFLTTRESGVRNSMKRHILDFDSGSSTSENIYTSVVSGRPARGLRSKLVADLMAQQQQQCGCGSNGGDSGAADDSGFVPDFPFQHYVTSQVRAEASKQNRLDYVVQWLGQGGGKYLSRGPDIGAGDLVKQIGKEAEMVFETVKILNR